MFYLASKDDIFTQALLQFRLELIDCRITRLRHQVFGDGNLGLRVGVHRAILYHPISRIVHTFILEHRGTLGAE